MEALDNVHRAPLDPLRFNAILQRVFRKAVLCAIGPNLVLSAHGHQAYLAASQMDIAQWTRPPAALPGPPAVLATLLPVEPVAAGAAAAGGAGPPLDAAAAAAAAAVAVAGGGGANGANAGAGLAPADPPLHAVAAAAAAAAAVAVAFVGGGGGGV